MFDYPTVADLTDFIVAQFSEGEDDAEGALGGGPVGEPWWKQLRGGTLWRF